MKNITKILMMVVLIASYACTTVDTFEEGATLPTTEKFVISLEETNRTSLGEKNEETNTYPVYWSEGDQISINGKASSILTDVADECTNAVFEFNGDLGGYPLKVSYPATEKSGTVFFAAEQNYEENTFESGVATMYSESSDKNISMRLLSTIVQIPVAIAEDGDDETDPDDLHRDVDADSEKGTSERN